VEHTFGIALEGEDLVQPGDSQDAHDPWLRVTDDESNAALPRFAMGGDQDAEAVDVECHHWRCVND
jgi:hypothetical protein